MKKLFFMILICYSYSVFSQQGSISGSIIDAKTKIPLSYVNIICKEKNNIINGGITNEKGNFTIKKLPLKNISLEIQFIGYLPIYKNVLLSKENSHFDLGTINLEENATALDEIEIRAETTTITQKIDKKVVAIGKDLTAAGTNSFEMLQTIPSIGIDYLNNEVTFKGSSNVRILVNGKPSNLNSSELLKSIPSINIKTVELISNPSARYNPEGMSGIINIILKKNIEIGFNGTITTGIEHSKNTRPNGALNLNYRAGIFNFYTNYALDFGSSETDYILNRKDKKVHQLLDHLNEYTDHNLKIGADIYLDKKNTFSIYSSQYFSNSDFYTDGYIYENTVLKLRTPNLSRYNSSESAYNLDYKLDLDENGHHLEVELNYSTNKNPEKAINKEVISPDSKLYNYTSNITDDRNTWLMNLDYIKPFKKGKLELGLEARIHNTFNEIITDQEITTFQNPSTPKGNTKFNYDRSIYSAYINYNGKFNKFSFQSGLRMEQFNVTGNFSNTRQINSQLYSDNIFNIYPSFYFNYSPSNKHDFQLSYSRRVDRPGIQQVTPIQEFTSPYIISVGNQELAPQYSNSFELNYTRNFKGGYFTFNGFFREISDQIGRNIILDEFNKDIQYISHQNYNQSNSYGLEAYLSLKPTKWWSFSPSFDLYVQDRFGILNTQKIAIENTVFKGTIVNRFKISKRLKLQLIGLYKSKSEGIQFTVDPFYLVNISAKLAVLNNKGSITFRATDIFNTLDYTFSSNSPFPQEGFYILEQDAIYFGFSYHFGSGKSKKRNRKKRAKNETRGGIL
ncbi:outer membrane beta-barrel family protein [Tenacibaculum maritimum]|uniref:outer membrane beta-barrel family protein n=1 Tax=Tenacibaculum maritimum TaxID=107401 RepID=UPI000466A317|nr:outer membrane beta-barrel family protein [Tenacibaculum maritimum]